jgi:hypothetical protein
MVMKNSKLSGKAAFRKSASEAPPRRRELSIGVLLFLLALALRLLFWQATPDAGWAYSAFYKGDAPVWLAYAEALQKSQPFELGLPLRPPGAGYLVAWLWSGRPSGLPWLRFLWCLMGAAVVPLVYLAARSAFGFRKALLAGLLTAASTGLLVLSTSLNNETPYLLLVAAVLALAEPLCRRPRPALLAAGGALHGLACLVRVEHALFFALMTGWLAVSWLRSGDRGSKRAWKPATAHTGVLVAAFVLVLVPWHLHAWRAVHRFNTEPPTLDPATEQALAQVEQAVSYLRWRPGAEAQRDALPACCRRNAADFVAATVAVRGGREVAAEDFQLLEEAFGSRPEALPEHPFVALYGPLNFYLANHAGAPGGFSRAPLEVPPPLAGGLHRYPAFLVAGLPPPQLTLTYPPHLTIVRRGYRLGGEWIRAHPGAFVRLAGEKLQRFWQGAALGLGGWNLPLGLSGVRRPVDLAVPQGPLATLWRLAVLALAAAGLWAGRRRWDLVPWTAFLASKVVVTVAFFGYARQGATVIPVVALLAALGLGRWLPESEPIPAARRHWLRGAAAAGLVLLALEGLRWGLGPQVRLDGRQVGASDPFPVDEYVERRVEVEGW